MASVYLDYGHGGSDPGAVGNGLKEKDMTLSIGRKVADILKRHKVVVYESRTNDKTLSLSARSSDANIKKADIFVSIHINAFSDANANGVETFSYRGSTNGAKLSKSIQDELIKTKLFKSNRGAKIANFHVIRETRMPSALTELGFITNTSDAAVIRNNQSELAEAVSKGVLGHLGVKYSPSTPKPSKPIVKPPVASPDAKRLYRVQVGAYSVYDNAKAELKRLEDKGFKGYIK